MSNAQRISYLLGSLLLGLSAVLMIKRPQTKGRAARAAHKPVEELVTPLQQAWGAYHNK
jgi:hypothetical protein